MEQVSKEVVNYRPADTERHCGNCVMFHSLFRIRDSQYDIGNIGTCDLVMGAIMNEDTCDRWEAKAKKSEQTPALSSTHNPLGTQGLWHTPSKKVPQKQQLPAYIQNIAHALMRDHGMDESRAIATAINAAKRWASGKGKVHPEVAAAAQAALAEWEKLKESHQ
jgi:hypothetical protein